MEQSWKTTLFGFVLILLAACGGSGKPTPAPEPTPTPVGAIKGPMVTQEIGPQGGGLSTPGVSLEIPPGALAKNELIGIQEIENHAHGGIGKAYRLVPEGVKFAKPVMITFEFTDADLAGTAPELLGVAYQDDKGLWYGYKAVALDSARKTVSIEADHFSDWSLFASYQLLPGSAAVRVSGSVNLRIVHCRRVADTDAPKPYMCAPSPEAAALASNWSANGVVGGSSATGTVVVNADKTATYTAPAQVPSSNPVAVSVEYPAQGFGKVLLVSNVSVLGEPCAGSSPANSCAYKMVEFNGETLPYTKLPRDPWENPETLTKGTLTLADSDGDGSGTWNIRYFWEEDRPGGRLEQFAQIGGSFHPMSNEPGTTEFLVPGDKPFSGIITEQEVTVNGVPFSTKNVTLSAQMKFSR
ncbi:MAG: hypothetical protein K6T57_14295 [Thermaceae bacterium]|nr:hypothetical protein [Thermaceae bacterium]